jgi:hypothetical protein
LTPGTGRTIFAAARKEVAMKKILTASLLLVLASASSAQVFFNGTFDEALVKAKSDNKKILLSFDSYT